MNCHAHWWHKCDLGSSLNARVTICFQAAAQERPPSLNRNCYTSLHRRLPQAAPSRALEEALQRAARRAVLATDAAFLRQARKAGEAAGTTALFALLLGSRSGEINR